MSTAQTRMAGYFTGLAKIGNARHAVLISHGMKTQPLNVNLTAELRRYVKDQVRTGRYQNENEVVRDAIRQMQQREIEQFERLFGGYPGAPQGEPAAEDDKAIRAAIQRHREATPADQAS